MNKSHNNNNKNIIQSLFVFPCYNVRFRLLVLLLSQCRNFVLASFVFLSLHRIRRVDLILGYQSVQCPCLIPCQPQEALSEALVVATLETLVSEQSVRPGSIPGFGRITRQ